MPFDQVSFALPAVETDEILRRLIEGRARLARVSDWMKSPGHGGKTCAYLAICHPPGSSVTLERATDVLLAALPKPGRSREDIWSFNDSHSHADVLALFDRAIDARRAAIASSTA